ncbi:MAG: DUF3575 domain-containing protein [Spirochaetia bacterium]|nr:DUF3575 domain-containing protein [Spirochaetia bacterium]
MEVPLWAQNNDTDQKQEKEKKKSILLFITPPIIGYGTITGLVYNFTPFGIEIPVSKLIGLRLESYLLYYSRPIANGTLSAIKPERSTAIQGVSLSIILPFYFNTNKENDIYNGFYIAPYAAPVIGFANHIIQFGVGAATGYAWNLNSNWHFNVGLALGYDFTKNTMLGGLDLNMGYWL